LYLESHNLLCESQYKFDLEVIAKAPILLQAKTEDIGIALEFLSVMNFQHQYNKCTKVELSGIVKTLKTFLTSKADVLHWIQQAHSAACEEFGDLAYQYARSKSRQTARR